MTDNKTNIEIRLKSTGPSKLILIDQINRRILS